MEKKTTLNCQHKHYNGAYFTSGNAVTPHQYSNYIRGFKNVTGPMGEERPAGALQDFDIGCLPRYIPNHVKNVCRQYAQEADSIVYYCVRHTRKGNVVILGHFIASNDGRILWETNEQGEKAREVLSEARLAAASQGQAYAAMRKARGLPL